MLQPFGGAAHSRKAAHVRAGPQPGKDGQTDRLGVGVVSGGPGRLVAGQGPGRDIGGQGVGAFPPPEGAQGAGAGVVAGGAGVPVVRALTGQGDGFQRRAQLEDGLAVFHRKVVVGLVQQGGKARAGGGLLHSGLPGGGKVPGPGGQLAFQGGAVGRGGQHPGRGGQAGGVGVLRAKDQRVAARRRQQGHPRPGKALGPRHGPGGGQGKDQPSPGVQGGGGPHPLGQKGRRAPLGQPAAEGHRDGLGAQRAGSLQLPGVAVVEGVVFGDDTGKFHGFSCFGLYVVHKFLSFCPFSLEKGPTLLYNVNE